MSTFPSASYDDWKLMSPDEDAERIFGPQEEPRCPHCGGPVEAEEDHYYRDGESGEYNTWMCDPRFVCCGAADPPCKGFDASCRNPENYDRRFAPTEHDFPEEPF